MASQGSEAAASSPEVVTAANAIPRSSLNSLCHTSAIGAHPAASAATGAHPANTARALAAAAGAPAASAARCASPPAFKGSSFKLNLAALRMDESEELSRPSEAVPFIGATSRSDDERGEP